MKDKIFFIVMGLIFIVPYSAEAVQIELKSGKVVEGEILEKTDDFIKIDTGKGIWRIQFRMMTLESLSKYQSLPNKAMPVMMNSGLDGTQTDGENGSTVDKEDDIDPEEIIKAFKDNYRGMKTLQYVGNYEYESIGPKKTEKSKCYFLVRLGRPDRYRIYLNTEYFDGKRYETVVWNNGNGPYAYDSLSNIHSQLPSNELAWKMVRYSQEILALFYPEKLTTNLFDNLQYKGNASYDDKECYLFQGKLMDKVNYTLWISKERKLLIKYEAHYKGIPQDLLYEEMTDEDIEYLLKISGRALTPDNMAIYRTSCRQKRREFEVLLPSGIMDQKLQTAYDAIIVDNFMDKNDFNYEPPMDTPFISQENIKDAFLKAIDLYPFQR